MDLNLKNLNEIKSKLDIYPEYNVSEVRKDTIINPEWLHFGAGNIFRGYVARLNQELIDKGEISSGISVVESFDEEIIDKIYKPYDNLSISVTLNKDGKFQSNLVANLSEALKLNFDFERISEIILKDSLKIVSFTITEKGYNLYTTDGKFSDIVNEDIVNGPEKSLHLMSKLVYLLYIRFKNGARPLTLLSLDNCSHNGDKLFDSIYTISKEWVKNNFIDEEFLKYLSDDKCVSFPLSMIDKITPRPSVEIEKYLNRLGLENISPIITTGGTYIAPYVNLEEAEYLVIEDKFANGRPPLEKVGVYMTDKQTVDKVETMKVTTCLNPLHTTLAIFGCLLGYESISDEMQDEDLLNLIKKIGYDEALPVVVNPGILDPKEFIDEVINIRLPNPYIPDTPQRIATDTSQKIPIRFGNTIKAYYNSEEKSVSNLKYIPLVLAGWLRYLLGVDDNGEVFDRSPDPLLDYLTLTLEDIKLGSFKETEKLNELLENELIFGVNLNEVGMGSLIVDYFKELCDSKNAVRKTLKKYLR